MKIIKQYKSRAFIYVLMTLFIFAAIATLIISNRSLHAAPVTGFNAGRIIDDFIFTNKSSMSPTDIQSFLNSKVPVCDTLGEQPSEFGGGTRAQWAASRGYSPPFTCLKDFNENGRSAAQIIYDTAQKYSINPQVLIVLLQKEQSLITDTWPIPASSQYKTATGYACPDTAPCDSQYFGLTNQLDWSGKIFRAILNNSPTWYTPYILGENFIQYNPNSSCGGSVVNIENRSTQALYNYTPYQPNAGALAAGWGQAPCGAYGNRNFYLYFTDWFGSTTVQKSTAYIPVATYIITNPTSNKVIDVRNSSTADGSAVQIYARNNSNAQKWRFTQDVDGFYSMKNLASGKYIDVQGGSVANGAKVQIWTGNTGCAQKWAAVQTGSGILFINKCSGRALDIYNGGTSNSTPLQIYASNSSKAQLWKLADVDPTILSDGLYSITNHGNLSLDVSDTDNRSLRIYTTETARAQDWHVKRHADGYYTIRNISKDRYMDVVSEGKVDGTKIQIWNKGASCAQKWKITKNEAGYFAFISLCSGLVLDVTNGATTISNTPVQLWTGNSTPAQQWNFTKLDSIPDSTYSIKTPAGTALDAVNGGVNNGTRLQVWYSNGTQAQKWQISRISDNAYSMKNIGSGRNLDLVNASSLSGTPVHLYDQNNSCAQKWIITSSNNGSYKIQSSCTVNNVLDVTGGKTSAIGTEVQSYESNNSNAQMWYFDAP